MPGEVPRGEELQGSGVGVAGTGDIYPAGAPATFALTTGGPCGGGSSQTRPTDSPSAPIGRGAGSEPTGSTGARSRPSSIAEPDKGDGDTGSGPGMSSTSSGGAQHVVPGFFTCAADGRDHLHDLQTAAGARRYSHLSRVGFHIFFRGAHVPAVDGLLNLFWTQQLDAGDDQTSAGRAGYGAFHMQSGAGYRAARVRRSHMV